MRPVQYLFTGTHVTNITELGGLEEIELQLNNSRSKKSWSHGTSFFIAKFGMTEYRIVITGEEKDLQSYQLFANNLGDSKKQVSFSNLNAPTFLGPNVD